MSFKFEVGEKVVLINALDDRAKAGDIKTISDKQSLYGMKYYKIDGFKGLWSERNFKKYEKSKVDIVKLKPKEYTYFGMAKELEDDASKVFEYFSYRNGEWTGEIRCNIRITDGNFVTFLHKDGEFKPVSMNTYVLNNKYRIKQKLHDVTITSTEYNKLLKYKETCINILKMEL